MHFAWASHFAHLSTETMKQRNTTTNNNQKRDDMSNIIAQGLSFLLEHCQGSTTTIL